MARTEGDDWFEQYLVAHGYEPGVDEPNLEHLGVSTRPDFLPSRGEQQVACEVEGFGANSNFAKRLHEQRTIVASDAEVYGPIRRRVGRAAKQLKPLTAMNLPLAVVLANTEGAPVDLSVQHVVSALYGNPRWTVQIDSETGGPAGEARLELGRDGKLTNDHAYVGAVVLLRQRALATDATAEIGAEVRGRVSAQRPRLGGSASNKQPHYLRRSIAAASPRGITSSSTCWRPPARRATRYRRIGSMVRAIPGGASTTRATTSASEALTGRSRARASYRAASRTHRGAMGRSAT